MPLYVNLDLIALCEIQIPADLRPENLVAVCELAKELVSSGEFLEKIDGVFEAREAELGPGNEDVPLTSGNLLCDRRQFLGHAAFDDGLEHPEVRQAVDGGKEISAGLRPEVDSIALGIQTER